MRTDGHPVVDARPRRVAVGALLVGAVLIGVTFGVPKGSTAFYVAGFALAATWLVAYALVPTPLRPGRRPAGDVILGLVAGSAMFAAFLVGAWVLGRIDLLDNAIDDIFTTADSSMMLWVIALAGINGVAEELFFRGTVIDAVAPRFAPAAGVIPYVLTTVPSGNVALVIAATVAGALFTALRIRTGALTAPITCHLLWSALMIGLFPR